MFCRRVWQRVGPLAWRVLSPTSRNIAPVRHMAFGVPGGSTNLTYFVLCGGGLTAAVVYAYKSVNGDADRHEDKLSNVNLAAKVEEAPAAEPAPAEEEPAPGAGIIVESLPAEPAEEISAEPVEETSTEPVEEASTEPVEEASAEPVEEASTEPVEEASAEPAAEISAEPVEEMSAEPTEEISAEPVAEASSEPVEDAASEAVVSEASAEPVVTEEDVMEEEAAGSPGTAAVDEVLPSPLADPETPSEALQAEAAPAAEVAA